MQKKSAFKINGLIGVCGSLDTFIGFAPARQLYSCSFADVLNEETGIGYQRPRNLAHSRSFRQYITQSGTSTIALTFNLRKEHSRNWQLVCNKSGAATLWLASGKPCLSQVDCQHRIGELADLDISLAFMTFLGLDLRSEMSLFNIINSRAKGLSSSLTDYHETRLLNDLATAAPQLLIAKRLNENVESPWYGLVRYGGESSSGLMRRTSLRMLQTSVRRFLKQSRAMNLGDVESQYAVVLAFWRAVKACFPDAWNDHRHHLITKGVGLYALMGLLANFVCEMNTLELSEDWFCKRLSPLTAEIDWSTKGMFAGAGGKKGAESVREQLSEAVRT